MNPSPLTPFNEQLEQHIKFIYPQEDVQAIVSSIIDLFAEYQSPYSEGGWSERDTLLITYGNSLIKSDEKPLETLKTFLDKHINHVINSVHILPFCPYSSDDGFSVIDYEKINPEIGEWDQINEISEKYRLMADVVINHVSAESEWFQNYLKGESPGAGYFIEADPNEDYSEVTRPRASPLLREVETPEGTKHVWCTFSHDQVDLNFENPQVLLEMLKVIRTYLNHGVRIFRLDAIGYLWKKLGTPCIHLPETHEVVRLIRTVLDHVAPDSIMITETNVPNRENLTYFGNQNEAHIVYNFSLAPLVTHALLTGEANYLKHWMMSMPPAPQGCTYLNFTASHDGIGMRPAEGLLSDEEQEQMVNLIESFGGKISRRSTADGTEKVYEINISLFDAFKGTVTGGIDKRQVERFLCSQTIMMGLEGIPAFYIHSLLGTPNDLEGLEKTGRSRSINRHQWDMEKLEKLIASKRSPQSKVLKEMLRRIHIRTQQPAFNPLATQFTLQLKPYFFGFWRQSVDRQQSLFAIHNLSRRKRKLELRELNLIYSDDWVDLITGEKIDETHGSVSLEPYECMWITNRSVV